ncbi:MAG: hypothetical protein AAFU71_06225 [Cyanobacteria bacterium J06632_22]
MSTEPELSIIVEVEDTEETPEPIEGQRGGRTPKGGGWGDDTRRGPADILPPKPRKQRVSIDAKLIKSQMQSMMGIIQDLFEQAQNSQDLPLNEVELSVEINAEGQVSLIGNGGKLGNTGAITLKFKRPEK